LETQNNIKHIVVLVHPGSTLLNLSAPVEVFRKAMKYIDRIDKQVDFSYRVHIVSAQKNKKIITEAGVPIICETSYQKITYPIDTLIVAGSPRQDGYKKEVLCWLKEQSGIVRRICSLCAGAFILAEAGILKNKKAVTHWELCDKMATTYPDIEVNMEAIFVKDGNVYTSAGVTAGLDLSLALIEEDLGKPYALLVARIMVLFLKRPGNQTQFSTVLESQKTDYQPVSQAVEWIYNHLNEDITVEKLAEQVLMSPRNFARVFTRELNITPIKYVEKLRIETACRYLTETQLRIDEIANLCGLKSSVNMNRTFMKIFETTPSQYRRNFSSSFS
jgi:transcriptional regulator GlxA family with amidase domain